ncbi:hypothetical protein LY90DRAFT_666366 [Neocallimastix californiae]|uniref:Uncharacterized protein n=1 Tax=Neocallimastix californiae TaxID=1754190 RepID=A0A1Y2ERM5_9FUNG|nr:hypothetical protein LY90DRAFT_666366 [Neocallimastix californiae]|eukprot:ORY74241.1 hypothetical protein LY90DRAFT_666366 [Neocallimastix californiae]
MYKSNEAELLFYIISGDIEKIKLFLRNKCIDINKSDENDDPRLDRLEKEKQELGRHEKERKEIEDENELLKKELEKERQNILLHSNIHYYLIISVKFNKIEKN